MILSLRHKKLISNEREKNAFRCYTLFISSKRSFFYSFKANTLLLDICSLRVQNLAQLNFNGPKVVFRQILLSPYMTSGQWLYKVSGIRAGVGLPLVGIGWDCPLQG